MLFNTEKLQGMPKKIKALARREAEVSLVQQVSINDTCRSFFHAFLSTLHASLSICIHTHTFCSMPSHKDLAWWTLALVLSSCRVRLLLWPLNALLPSGDASA